MRIQSVSFALVAAALLVACDDPPKGGAPAPSASAAIAAPLAVPAPSAAPAKAASAPPVVCESGSTVTFRQPGLEAEVRTKLAKPDGALTRADLAKVKSINLVSAPTDSLDPCVYKHFTGLHDLFLGPGELQDLTPLSVLPQLLSLRVAISKVKDLSPLVRMVHLDRLDIGRTQVTDLATVGELTDLTELEIDEDMVTDLAPLSKCSKLEKLSMKGTAVKDLRPLLGLKKLRKLWIAGSPISDTHVLDPLVANGLKILTQ